MHPPRRAAPPPEFILSACLAGSRRAPAPDGPALALKPVLSEVEGLDLLVADQAWELDCADAAFAALRPDARRLPGPADFANVSA
jgi:hypothetical protein